MTNLLGTLLRWLYNTLILLAMPWVKKRLAKENINQFSNQQRQGHITPFAQPVIWAHCASVGEVVAAAPLLAALMHKHPNKKLVVTTMTATGAARVKQLLPDAGNYLLPLDLPANTQRFVRTLKPLIGIIFETEIWPNLYLSCHQAGIPLILANGRLSSSTTKTYLKFRPLIATSLNKLSWLAAKSATDAAAFKLLGMPENKMSVTGTLKFDLQLPEDFAQKHAQLEQELKLGKRPVWIAASTNAGEEEQVLAAHQAILAQQPETLLILVPRHPQRFAAIAQLIQQQGFSLAQRSLKQLPTNKTQVYLADTLGELLYMYAQADMALVCGSLVPVGGHNLLEPALVGVPIIAGPYTESVADMVEVLAEKDALRQVANAEELPELLLNLWRNPQIRDAMQLAAGQVLQANRGSLAQQLKIIETELKKNSLNL